MAKIVKANLRHILMHIPYHRLHDLLIYSFESETKKFLVRAYIDGNLSAFKVSFQEISEAMNSEHVIHWKK